MPKFKIEKGDLKLLDDFKIKGYKEVELDWFGENISGATTISQLPNTFDELYPENNI